MSFRKDFTVKKATLHLKVNKCLTFMLFIVLMKFYFNLKKYNNTVYFVYAMKFSVL